MTVTLWNIMMVSWLHKINTAWIASEVIENYGQTMISYDHYLLVSALVSILYVVTCDVSRVIHGKACFHTIWTYIFARDP